MHVNNENANGTLSWLEKKLLWLMALSFKPQMAEHILALCSRKLLRDGDKHVITVESCQTVINRLKTLALNDRHRHLQQMTPQDKTWVRKALSHIETHPRDDILTHLMMAIYLDDTKLMIRAEHDPDLTGLCLNGLMTLFEDVAVDMAWLDTRPPMIRWFIVVALLAPYYSAYTNTRDHADLIAYFKQNSLNCPYHEVLYYLSATLSLMLGDVSTAIIFIGPLNTQKSVFSQALLATVSTLQTEYEKAIAHFIKSHAQIKRAYHLSDYYFDTMVGFFHACCLMRTTHGRKSIQRYIEQYENMKHPVSHLPMASIYTCLSWISLIEHGFTEQVALKLKSLKENLNADTHPFVITLYHWLSHLTNGQHLRDTHVEIQTLARDCLHKHYYLAVHILYELLEKTGHYETLITPFFEENPFPFRLLNVLHPKAPWEYRFSALEDALLSTEGSKSRLIWLLNPKKQALDVIEQRMTKSGKWTPGRAISLKKLAHYATDKQLHYLTTEDKRVIDTFEKKTDGHEETYQFHPQLSLLALVGHPLLFHMQNRQVSLSLQAAEPSLLIESHPTGFRLSLSHWSDTPDLRLEAQGIHHFTITHFTEAFVEIGRILTQDGLIVPADAKEKLLHMIQRTQNNIQIETPLEDNDRLIERGDATPCVQLMPIGEGLKLTIWAKPLPMQPYYYVPGQGKALLTLNDDKAQQVSVQRDFTAEKKAVQTLLMHYPPLAHFETDAFTYDIDTLEDSLEVFSALEMYLQEKPLTIEWAEGDTFRIKHRVDSGQLALSVTSHTNWFEYQGTVRLNQHEVIELKTVLNAMKNQAIGRFVQLKPGEFIELTEQLKKQLQLLDNISDDRKIHPLSAQILSDIAETAEQATFDNGFKAHLKQLTHREQTTPTVPSTLQATLRDYQIDGFQYLSRLTNWQIGACLADDMGLGKTIQTIALLLARAEKGPALVIAPTSVCFNWVEEISRFAPTLKTYDLRMEDREAIVEKAAPFDVILCSYGLLQHNQDLLAKRPWETIVLDEAQAIKNPSTQRWKAVMALKAPSRIALTGTPIENHLGELWSIFSFINPGLLGSIQRFQTKYMTPIENQSKEHLYALKRLVSPFILRRLKSDVLTELPPKTEQIIYVTQTTEEATFYEALRQQAETRVTSLLAGQNRIAILAEMSKLRQACCDARLVNSSLTIPNSKLDIFIETVQAILENGHRILVFSQYVSFLTLVKARLVTENITFQYLDGGTSARAREQAVNAFQNGEGDLFLLSLKAGGSGLNLTAADYVIHLDPWWNPAVEDQASDRAHRIGQLRPVTVYRLIMQHTIEEKIIALHQKKRDLADELLNEQSMGGKLSNGDLLALIRRGGVG